jgi:hypothetical protein
VDVKSPEATLVDVWGIAGDRDGIVSGVTVGFQVYGTQGTIHKAVTGSDGLYDISLPPGDYLVVCLASEGSCLADAWRGRVGKEIQIDGAQKEINLTVSKAALPHHPTLPRDDNASVHGVVMLPDGRTVSGATVEFRVIPDCPSVCQEPWVKTDGSGAYSISLQPGTYNAECLVDNEDYECGVRNGTDGPYPVQVPPSDQQIDFIVCLEDQYPACLNS